MMMGVESRGLRRLKTYIVKLVSDHEWEPPEVKRPECSFERPGRFVFQVNYAETLR
jgi:hypothetical protein